MALVRITTLAIYALSNRTFAPTPAEARLTTLVARFDHAVGNKPGFKMPARSLPNARTAPAKRVAA